jgi:predicted RNase H-like HicB family nuclease
LGKGQVESVAQASAKTTAPSGKPVTPSQRERLEKEIESLQNALTQQDLSIRKGYICTVYDAGDGYYIGSCPTLHAGSQGRTHEDASHGLDDAIEAVFEAFQEWGRPLPSRDTETRCHD